MADDIGRQRTATGGWPSRIGQTSGSWGSPKESKVIFTGAKGWLVGYAVWRKHSYREFFLVASPGATSTAHRYGIAPTLYFISTYSTTLW